MPIPFQDAEDIEELGWAAFLQLEPPLPGSTERQGALLLINARGEPLEFVYNRIELLSSVLWRPADRELAAIRRLALTLFHAATLAPTVLLCRANVVAPHLFGPDGQITLDIPVGRIATGEEAIGYTETEYQATVTTPANNGDLQESHLFWSAPPTGAAANLFARLAERGLLLEPFARAAKGLREVYGESPSLQGK